MNTFKYFTNFKILKIIREKDTIKIFDREDNYYSFSKLIFATHADQVFLCWIILLRGKLIFLINLNIQTI